MAKSMRSKSKRRFRAIKRQNVFAPVEEARLRRLAAKQAEATRVSDNKNNKNNMDYEAQTTTVEEDTQGSSLYMALGLIDTEFLDVENIMGWLDILNELLSA